MDQNPDMLEDEQTKEELHQRVDDLTDVLLDLVESKKEESSEELKNIMQS